MQFAASHTPLPVKTKVQVKNQKGSVISSQMVTASNGGMIALNKVMITHRFKRGFGATGKWIELRKVKLITPNYAFIQIL